MGESLTQQRRVSEEGLRVVKLCQCRKTAYHLIGVKFDGIHKGSTG